jgi:hypothetical protein
MGAVYTVCAGGCTWSTIAEVNAAPLKPGDSVLFRPGETFPGLLEPTRSGKTSKPIVYGSSVGGQASLPDGIALRSVSNLVFQDLLVDGGDWSVAARRYGVITRPKPSSGATSITIRRCTFRNVLQAILSMNPGDSNWRIEDSLLERTGDSAVLIHDESTPGGLGGSDWTFVGNRILDSGLAEAELGYALHGIYAISRNLVVRGNVIRGFETSGVSLRALGGVVEGNTISNGPIGITFAPYDSVGLLTTIAYNRISTGQGIAIYRNSGYRSVNPESFQILSNTIVDASEGIRVVGAVSATIRNNTVVLRPDGNPVLQLDPDLKAADEANNLWYRPGGASWSYRYTAYYTLSAYQAASRLGGDDRVGDPQLDPTTLEPAATSPVVDAGAKKAGVKYTRACDGGLYHFCGTAPELGAVELLTAAAFDGGAIAAFAF